ncbi:nuclear mitotic apparatus protein 1-like isoform X2 [Stigmatopora nigra]
MANLGVKALVTWVNSIILTEREINMDDLIDGDIILRVISRIKNEPVTTSIKTTEERFELIAEFVQKDCRFGSTNDTSLSWENIKNGINLTVEIAKLLLMLVYHDMMNERSTLKALEYEVERKIANMTNSFIMESFGCVYLKSGLDTYLAKRYLSVDHETLDRTSSTSLSLPTVSSLSEEDSPVFHLTPRVTFLNIHTVASSSVSKSPLQDIMNTPKFQLRNLQRQIIQEKEYRDGLERELASKISLITSKESHINRLEYNLGKMKVEQNNQEQNTKATIDELESKIDFLQQRLHEILNENKDFKSNSSLLERKVDELENEKGVLSSQVRAAYAQLSMSQTEVSRLKETLASFLEEWRTKIDYLNSELNQATSQKEVLTEQVQILQGKISCLEDDLKAARKEDVGENMGPVIERENLRCEIVQLRNQLDKVVGCLSKAAANEEEQLFAKSEAVQHYKAQKTPCGGEDDETFYSLTSARSHPNLSSATGIRPISMEPFETPGKMTAAGSHQLSGLPGYRQRTLHLQSTSTFCVETENEPAGPSDDWMRIAELQARNKACLPHLKSSYPVEFENGSKSTFLLTDEDIRSGDPNETIRRASFMPSQLQGSVGARRHSLVAPQSTVSARSHRSSLMAGYRPSKLVSSSQLRSPRCQKRSAFTLSVPLTPPEKKMKASCFPRPLTPKNKNSNTGSSSSHLHATHSPADRRQSMMFTINNTPKSNRSNYLKRGLNKLRSASQKSPGKTPKRPPVNSAHKDKMPSATSIVALGRGVQSKSFKSPQVKDNRKSPKPGGKAAKSPWLTESARKIKI